MLESVFSLNKRWDVLKSDYSPNNRWDGLESDFSPKNRWDGLEYYFSPNNRWDVLESDLLKNLPFPLKKRTMPISINILIFSTNNAENFMI